MDDRGEPAPADVEFGFVDGDLMLFQIRPFLDSRLPGGIDYLREMDSGLADMHGVTVDMGETP